MSTQMTFLAVPTTTPKLSTLRETPVARIRTAGAETASLLELLGAIIGPDTALAVLTRFPTIQDLARANLAEIEQHVHGVGPTGAARLKAALELGRRLLSAPIDEQPQVRSPADAANLLMPTMSMLEQEHLCAILLNTRNRVIQIVTIYIGSLNSTPVRIADLFRQAVRLNAAAVIVAHNHPSGDPSPSLEDVSLTRNLITAGQIMDVEILDHLVIGHGQFVSLKERGLAFS